MTLLYWQRHMLLQILYLLCFTSLSRAFASSSSPRRNRSSISYAITYDDNHPNPNCYNKSPTLIYASSNRQGGDSGNRRDGDAITDRNDSEGASNTKSLLPSTAAMENKAMQGRIILLFVSFLYGTLNVSLRAIYATDGAPVASVLSFIRQCLSVLIFIPIYIATEQSKNIHEKGDDDKDTNTNTNVGDGKRKEGEEEDIKPMLLAGLELALWNFGAQGFVTAGLLSSPAARASFLTQTSVVMTPLLSALAGEKIKSSVWGGCGLALCGLLFLISTTTSTGDVIEGSSIDSALSTINVSQGDVLILLGALSWSTYIFRTSKLANNYKEVDLQFTKTALLAVMYGGWFLYTAVTTTSLGTSAGWKEAITLLWYGITHSLGIA